MEFLQVDVHRHQPARTPVGWLSDVIAERPPASSTSHASRHDRTVLTGRERSRRPRRTASTTPSPGPRRHRPGRAAVPAPMEIAAGPDRAVGHSAIPPSPSARTWSSTTTNPTSPPSNPSTKTSFQGGAGGRSGRPAPPRPRRRVPLVATRVAHDLNVALDAEVVVIHPIGSAKPKGRRSQTLSEPRDSTGTPSSLGPEEIEVQSFGEERRRRCGEPQPRATAAGGRRPQEGRIGPAHSVHAVSNPMLRASSPVGGRTRGERPNMVSKLTQMDARVMAGRQPLSRRGPVPDTRSWRAARWHAVRAGASPSD